MNAETVEKTDLNLVKEINKLMPQQDPSELKIKINTLLWENLPANTTIEQAEEIACKIVAMIIHGDIKSTL